MATKNIPRRKGTFRSTLRFAIGFPLVVFLLSGSPRLQAEGGETFAARQYSAAEATFQRQGTNVTAALGLARAAFDWAELAASNEQRAQIAGRGIAAARRAASLQPTNAAAHYWLAMNLGQLARTKSLGALKMIKEIEAAFQRARTLDERIDFAGPHRALGLLYRDAPGWPASVGDRKKARFHLERAVALAPEFPDNQLALLESHEKWLDRQDYERQLKVAEATLARALTNYTGPEWRQSRHAWEKQIKSLRSSRIGDPVQTKGAGNR